MPEFDVAAVRLPSGTWTSPPAKAQKRFADGQGDDLVAYYEVMRTRLDVEEDRDRPVVDELDRHLGAEDARLDLHAERP